MARKIVKHLRSREHTHIGDEVIPVKPLPRQMEVGEIALNYLAGFERIFIKNSNDEVVTFYPNGGGGETPVAITVDDHLDSTSENPVQNKVIVEALNDIVAGGVVVDDELSDVSENPVQNKVIKEALDEIIANQVVVDDELSEVSENPVQNKVITEVILDNELTTAAALTNLNDNAGFNEDGKYVPLGTNVISEATTLSDAVDLLDEALGNVATRADLDSKQDLLTIDTQLSTTSTNLVQNKVITQTIIDNELTTAAALTKMNDSAGFTNNGDYAPNGTNVVTNATSLAEAIDLLDDALGNVGGTDDKVAQTRIDATDSATNINYPLLLANDANPNGTAAGANYSGMTYNPRTNNGTLRISRNQTSQQMEIGDALTLTSNQITFVSGSHAFSDGTLTRSQYSGNAATATNATNATNDENGDQITTTYLKVANLNNAIAAYLENNGINGGEYYGTV